MATVNLVARATHPLTFTELQRASGLPKATLHRLLATLMREGLVRFETKDRSYRLGCACSSLRITCGPTSTSRAAAADELALQAQATGETMELGVLSDDHVVVVPSHTPGETPGAASATGGDRRPLHARDSASASSRTWKHRRNAACSTGCRCASMRRAR